MPTEVPNLSVDNFGITRATEVTPLTLTLPEASQVEAVVAATWNAGANMLQHGNQGENVVVSPASLLTALSMLAEGARGETLTEMEQALGASGPGRQEAFAALRQALAIHDGDPAVVQADELPESPLLHLASQVVVDDQLEVAPAFLTALAQVYDAGVQHIDLGSAAGKQLLDAWVKYHSGGLIEESAIQPDPMLRMVLQDAITFAARWEVEFKEFSTSDADFYLSADEVEQVPMMRQTGFFAFAEVDGWTAVRKPYAGGDFYADFILPPLGVDPASASAALLTQLNGALASTEQQLIDLGIPKLDIRPEQPLDLRGPIADLGMPLVLDSQAADLTGVGSDSAGNRLYLGQAFQQAVLIVDEAGTRAAAVTEMGIMATGIMIPGLEFILNRPFAMQIVHTESGWPLFMAAIRNPIS
jgi:serine protease inhibitor